MNGRARVRRSRAATDVSASAFAWEPGLKATLQHCSLPWEESLAIEPLPAAGRLGLRDRISLLAQFAAHQALLQFAGLADADLEPEEWGVVRKRGCDIRLVRLAARAVDATAAPPPIAAAQQFASRLDVDLEILRQPWARADAIYAEAFSRLSGDVAADLRWVRLSACGAISAPGPDGLQQIVCDEGRYSYQSEETLHSVERLAKMEGSIRVVSFRGVSPLERYSALRSLLVGDPGQPPVAIAEAILASTAAQRHIFAVSNSIAFDAGSREVVELLANARHGSWLTPDDGQELPPTKPFIVAPLIASRARLLTTPGVSPFEFVTTPAFDSYLAFGEVPQQSAALPSLIEPFRSYVAAVGLLGLSVPAADAKRFLAEFLFRGSLEDLVVHGITTLADGIYSFASESVREEVVRLIPAASRPSIARVAAQHTSGVRAALLWLDAGDTANATAALEQTEWTSATDVVAALRRVPASVLTQPLVARYASALVHCGRYRDACRLAPDDEVLLARAERRMGDYATALARLERLERTSFEVALLRAEVLRLLGRDEEAGSVLAACKASNPAEQSRLDYECGLHGADVSLPSDAYLAARLATYRALERGDFELAATHASASHERASTLIERIDASLDRLFAAFSAGAWQQARFLAVEALQEVEETQGDRAAGGILFTLAYLAADAGQWAHAEQRIARLRHYYSSVGDDVRLAELPLLSAHLDFCRGRFSEARKAACSVFDARQQHDQIREAAALILDEIDWVRGETATLRSTGESGNKELRRRHLRLVRCAAQPDAVPEDEEGIPARLFAFRRALAVRDLTEAKRIAGELDLVIEDARSGGDQEMDLIRSAATLEFPFAAHDFDLPWCFATRNRLGQWHSFGSFEPSAETLNAAREGLSDWIVSGDRELLFFEGSSGWRTSAREALAAVFSSRAETYRLRRVVAQELSAEPPARGAIEGIVGQSASIREIEAQVALVARRDVPVCILGESGTGKELVARAIHRQSPRRTKTFTPVNCAALPENLIESELFGHVRGAFTGADRDRAGLIETTEGGTLFLDEIGELPLPAQAKLLRFLQEGEFRRVGDTTNRTADVRIVSATNRRLDTAVEQGRFRDDLYYRVRGVEVLLPPLRERGGDILLLASHFLRLERERHGTGAVTLSPETEAIFTTYAWPGNVREMQNTIRAAHAMAGEARQIEVGHLPERLRKIVPAKATAGSYQDSVARFKRELIERSLLEAKGNQNRAAAMLKMSRQALAYQIRELGILVRV